MTEVVGAGSLNRDGAHLGMDRRTTGPVSCRGVPDASPRLVANVLLERRQDLSGSGGQRTSGCRQRRKHVSARPRRDSLANMRVSIDPSGLQQRLDEVLAEDRGA